MRSGWLKRFRWYANRLMSMSPGEIVYRFGNQIELRRERSAVKKPDHGYAPYPIPAGIFANFKEEGWSNFFFSMVDSERLRELIRIAYSDGVQATLAVAEGLLNQQITFFGRTLDLDSPINWFKDPLTGNVWPVDFWAAVDIRDGQTVGGVKWVRELNRHHHFVTLGKAYWLSGEERFARALCSQFSSWIEANPPFVGVNWSSALGNAIRVINWIWALNFVHRSPALSEALFGRIIAALVSQTDFIGRNLSKFSSANNHLIGEAAGLAFAGLTLPWLKEAKRWRNRGMEILTEEIGKQIYPDGVMAEQAISYLGFDLDFYLLVWQAAVLNGFPIPTIWKERLGAAGDFICHMMDGAGQVPALGDSDDGRVLELDEWPGASRFRSILATASVLLERPDFKEQAGGWDEKSHWLLGSSGREKFERLAKRPLAPASTAFKDGGYYVMRQGDTQLIFDCGPLGYLSLAAHGHADALSLLLAVGGQPVLIDPGTYAYREGGAWRQFFRGTSAHNTIVVDDLDQSEMRGDFLWGRRATPRLVEWRTSEEYDLCTAEHDGYSPVNVLHQRTVLFYKPDWVLVVDRLTGQGVHRVAQNWHFPIEAEIDKIDAFYVVKVNNTTVKILTDSSATVNGEIRTGDSSPIQGWVSRRYGHKKPAPVLQVSGEISLPITMTTLFYLGEPLETEAFFFMKKRLQQIAG